MASISRKTSRPWILLALLACAWGPSPLAFAEGASVANATDAQKESAQTTFLAALEKSKAGDHEGALAEFKVSYDIIASPNTRLMIARELSALGRAADAYREAKAAVAIAEEAMQANPKYADAAKAATDEAANMATKVAFVRVDMGGRTGLELLIGGRSVPSEELGGPIPVEPGDVEVTIRGGGAAAETKRVTVAAGAEGLVSFALVEPPPPPKVEKSPHPFDGGEGQRITAYALGGVGAAGMLLFATFGGLTAATFSDLEERCPNNACPPSDQAARDDADTGGTYQVVANTTLVIGIVGLAAGAAFFIPTLFPSEDETEAARVEPVVGPGYIGMRGSF